MSYTASAYVWYDTIELLDEIKRLCESWKAVGDTASIRKVLYNFGDMRALEGIFFVSEDMRLIPASAEDVEKYRKTHGELPEVKVRVYVGSSVLEYLLGVVDKDGKRVKPRASVTYGSSSIPSGTTLNFWHV